MEEKRQAVTGRRREPGLLVALIPLVAMALLLGIGYGIYRVKAQVLLVAAAFLTGCLCRILGFTWNEMQQGIVESIRKALPAILIMLCVGVLIASWIACGTIPMLLYYGLKLISPRYFLVTACLVCSITSLATGTSWGTVGTIGVAFIGIAMGLGIPLGPAAGAIVAGAYFGDKFSPLSDIPNLAPAATGANLYDHLRHMLWSGVPAWIAGLLIYLPLGMRYASHPIESENLRLITTTLESGFRFNVVLVVPMLIVFYAAVRKKPVVPGMLISSLIAGALAVFLQRASITDIAAAMNSGYQAHTGVASVDRLLSRGGLMSMMETLLIAFTAFSFGGIMQRTGLLQVILDRVMKVAKQVWSLVMVTVVATLMTALVTGSSYLSMLIPGELLAPIYKRKNLAAKNLSRIVEECGAIIVPLIPWSMAGVYISGVLGVPTVSYLPWAFMNYVAVLILILFGVTGFTMAPRTREDETV